MKSVASNGGALLSLTVLQRPVSGVPVSDGKGQDTRAGPAGMMVCEDRECNEFG
jgi:hypothetical protein